MTDHSSAESVSLERSTLHLWHFLVSHIGSRWWHGTLSGSTPRYCSATSFTSTCRFSLRRRACGARAPTRRTISSGACRRPSAVESPGICISPLHPPGQTTASVPHERACAICRRRRRCGWETCWLLYGPAGRSPVSFLSPEPLQTDDERQAARSSVRSAPLVCIERRHPGMLSSRFSAMKAALSG
jgi:hypothetical protein